MSRRLWIALGLAVATTAHADGKSCPHTLPGAICVEAKPGPRDDAWQVEACRRGACVVAFPIQHPEVRVRNVVTRHGRITIIVDDGDDDHPTQARGEPISAARLSELDRQLSEREIGRLLSTDRFAPALSLADRALATHREARETLLWQRVVALYGLGRVDEALAAWRPLVAANRVRAYEYAARYGILRPTLEQPEIVTRRATTPGTARIHADGTFAGGDIAFAAGGREIAVIESNECSGGDQVWLRVGAVEIPLGRWKPDGSDDFIETGVTVANRFLRDGGYVFDPHAETGRTCENHDDVTYFEKSKQWLVKQRLQSRAPSGVAADQCTTTPSSHADPPPFVYVPAIGRVFAYHTAMRGCGDGGTDPFYWEELTLRPQ